jgi:hypothetical protein
VTALVNDALVVLDALDGIDLDTQQAEAVGLLALVAGQDVEPGDRDGTWRIAQRTAANRVVSVVDPESRHVHKTVHNYRDGFKAHIAVEPDTGIITACDLTAGNVGDAQAAPGLLAHESEQLEVLADSAYGSGEFRAVLAAARHRAQIKPIPLRAHLEGGFTIDDFTVDFVAGTATCPADHTVTISATRRATFGARCRDCPLRTRCTTRTSGRVLTLHEHHELLAAAREHARSDEFIETYRQHRPLVERTIAWLVRRHRKVQYRGIARNAIGVAHRCAAVNLQRLLNLGLDHDGERWIIATT